MGLGLNGGGLASALYFARAGAKLCITDMRDAETLAPSIAELKDYDIRYVLGHHDIKDFENMDILIKNPGVASDSPYLQAAKKAGVSIETDLSVFFKANLKGPRAKIIAVSGSKGKSSVSSALFWVLDKASKEGIIPGKAYLGGNIAVSPLSFLDSLQKDDIVVLELSSWQLGDLREIQKTDETMKEAFKPRVALITAIMPDHLDRYGSMEAYVADKRFIYHNQDKEDTTVVGDDEYGRSFAAESKGRIRIYHAKAQRRQEKNLLPEFQQRNMSAVTEALLDLGLPGDFIEKALSTFPGVEHRLEMFFEEPLSEGTSVRWYNDSAATIPQAAVAALEALSLAADTKIIMVCGGSDKNLDLRPLADALLKACSEKRLLAAYIFAGKASEKLLAILQEDAYKTLLPLLKYPVNSAGEAAEGARKTIQASGGKHKIAVLLSPGCASFGLFKNEFYRGRQWKDAVIANHALSNHE